MARTIQQGDVAIIGDERFRIYSVEETIRLTSENRDFKHNLILTPYGYMLEGVNEVKIIRFEDGTNQLRLIDLVIFFPYKD